MATGNEILSYTGNANLAAATGGGPWGVAETPQLDQASRDLAIMAVQRNRDLYNQRVEDRDEMFRKIDSDELVLKDVLDTDRSRLEGKVKQFQDYFYENAGDIMGDPKKYRDFVQKYQEAMADIKESQKARLAMEADLKVLAKTTNSTEQAQIKRHIEQQLARRKTDFYKAYEPYAPFLSFDVTKMGMGPIYNEAQSRWEHDPKFGNMRIDEATLNEDAIRANVAQSWYNPQSRDFFTNERGTGMLDQLTPDYIAKVNEGLARYNQESGKNHAPLSAADSPDEAAFKIALSQAPYRSVKKGPDAEVNNHERDQAQTDIGWANAAAARMNAETARMQANNDARYKEWTMENGGSRATKSQADFSFDFAKDLLVNKLGGLGRKQVDGKGNAYAIVEADKMNQVVPEWKKYLGTSTYLENGKVQFEDANLKGKAIIIRDDGQVFAIDKDDLKKNGSGYTWTNGKLTALTNLQQVAGNRLKDMAQSLGSGELGAASNINTGGESGSEYNQSSRTTGPVTLKKSYSVNGKTYTVSELQQMGYTPEQIQQAVQNGKLK